MPSQSRSPSAPDHTPNAIDLNGITKQALPEIIDEIVNGSPSFPGLATIYPGANTEPNSPDGNLINIIAQAKADVLEFFFQIATSMDPDEAIGRVLDARCAINGVTRYAGSNTIQSVSVTASQALTLAGLDTAPTAPFAVADAQGTLYQLISSHTFSAAGTASLAFRAARIGPITSMVNTITTITTPTLGITSVTNPAAPTSVGTDEETDAALRVRRTNSVELPTKGYLEGMRAGILNVPGVLAAFVKENDTDTTSANGMPPHSMWIIVEAPASSNAAIAAAIYAKRNAGVAQTNAGTGATATVTLDGTTVDTIAVDTGGSGYSNAPQVVLTGGGGSGATAHAVLTAGVVTSIVVDTAGTGYSTAPTVAFNPSTVRTEITQADATTFPVYFDNPTSQPLYFSAQVGAMTGTVDLPSLSAQLAAALRYDIAQPADASSIVALLKTLAPNCYVGSAEVSDDDATWADFVETAGINYQFSIPVGNITLTS